MRVDVQVLRRALDTLDDVVYIYDENDRLVYWNRRLNELYGLSDAELDGMPATEFFGAGEKPVVQAAIDEIRETGETVVEAVSQTVEGPLRFELTGRRLTDEDGEVVGFAGIGRDVTARSEQAGQLSRQNERLAEFADVLAHDLRNPLSVASGHLSLLEGSAEPDSLDALVAAHERMDRIISDVRTAAHEGALATDVEPLDAAAVASEAWEYVDTGDATFDCPETLPLDADADRLLRLFENLFRNSLDHADTDDPLTVRLEPTTAGFAVEDTGTGIDPADRERVFDPGVSDTGGTGFGLYIVRTIATAHGWEVAVTAGDTGGARFEFDLP